MEEPTETTEQNLVTTQVDLAPTKQTRASIGRKAAEAKENPNQKLQIELAEKLMEAFDFVVADRSNYYENNPGKIPDANAVDAIVSSYSTKNMAISGGVSLIPGPWGMAAAIPEVALVIRNQLAMIYDIGMAYGRGQVLNKELLAGIFLSATGAGASALLVIKGGQVLVKRATLRFLQRIIMMLAGDVTQQMLKSMISKWVPIGGALFMAAWSNYTTRKIGRKAVEVLEHPIQVADEVIDDVSTVDEPSETLTALEPSEYAILEIKALIGLLKADRKIKPQECGYIETLIEHVGIPADTKTELAKLMDSKGKVPVDFGIFAKDPDQSTGLLMDLIALAKRDGEFHVAEKIYIRKAAKLMGLSDDDVKEAMATPGD